MFILISNNPRLFRYRQCRIQNSTLEVLHNARDLIHQGHKLLMHPRYGNLQPKEWIYRTLILSKESAEVDVMSLNLIEDAISIFLNIQGNHEEHHNAIRGDYEIMDEDIILQSIHSLGFLPGKPVIDSI